MSASEHSYTVELIGTPDVPLAFTGSGRLLLDETRAPHVTGSLDVAVNDEAILDALDFRLNARIRVTVDAEFPWSTQHREFDLCLTDRSVDPITGDVTLSVASDESLLIDYAPLADDNSTWALQGSIRDIVEYVLDEAIPGATLAAGVDADLTSYWDMQNQLANPSVEGALAPWTAGGNCTLFHSTAWVGAPAGTSACGFTSVAAGLLAVSPNAIGNGPAVTAGKAYTFSGYGRAFGATARSIYAVMRWLDAAGIPVAPDVEGTPVALTDTAWARCSITATCPPRATRAEVFYRVSGSTASGQIGYIDGAMFNEGPLVAYFDGSTTDTAFYAFDWAGTANASASSRRALVEAPDPDAFVWRAGQSAVDFLHPLVQAVGLRLVCDETRTWTLRDENFDPGGSLTVRQGVNLIEGSDRISRSDDSWFDAAVTPYEWVDAAGIRQVRVDAFALVASPTRVRLFEKRTPYPGPGFSEYAVRRAQGRGREVSGTVVADWRTRAEQFVTFRLDNSPVLTGTAQSVEFDLDRDRMQVTTRSVDTPESAWLLIPADEEWLDSPVGESWTEEVIGA